MNDEAGEEGEEEEEIRIINSRIWKSFLEDEIENGLELFEYLISGLERGGTGASSSCSGNSSSGSGGSNQGVVANAHTFNALLRALKMHVMEIVAGKKMNKRHDDVESVKKTILDAMMNIFEEMEPRFGVQRTSETYEIMIDTLFKVRRVGDAMTLSQSMPNTIHPTPQLITCIMDGMFKNGQQEHALSMWNKYSESMGDTLDIVCVNVVLDGLMGLGHVKQALELLESDLFVQHNRKREPLCPSDATYSIIVKGIIAHHGVDKAEQWLKSATHRFGRGGDMLTTDARNVILHGLLAREDGKITQEDLEYAKLMFKEMNENGLADSFTYSIMVNGCTRHGDIHYALQIVEPLLEAIHEEVESFGSFGVDSRNQVPILLPLLRALAISYSSTGLELKQSFVERKMERIFRGLISIGGPEEYTIMQMLHFYTVHHRFDKVMYLCDEYLSTNPNIKWRFDPLFVDLISRSKGNEEHMAGIIILYSILKLHKKINFNLSPRTLNHIIKFTKNLIDYSDDVLTLSFRIIHESTQHDGQILPLLRLVDEHGIALDNSDTVVIVLEVLARINVFVFRDNPERDAIARLMLSRVEMLLSSGRCSGDQTRTILSATVKMIQNVYGIQKGRQRRLHQLRRNMSMERVLRIAASQETLALNFIMEIYSAAEMHTESMLTIIIKLFCVRRQVYDLVDFLKRSHMSDNLQVVMRIFLDELFSSKLDRVATRIVRLVPREKMDTNMLNTILSVYKKHGRNRQVSQLLDVIESQMGGKLPKFDAVTEMMLFQMDPHGTRSSDIGSIFRSMIDENFVADVDFFNSILLHMTRSANSGRRKYEKNVDNADIVGTNDEYVQETRSSRAMILNPDNIVSSTLDLLIGHDANFHHEVLTKVFHQVEPTHVTFGIAINHSARHGHFDIADRLLASALQLPTASTFDSVALLSLFLPLMKSRLIVQGKESMSFFKQSLERLSEFGVDVRHPAIIKLIIPFCFKSVRVNLEADYFDEKGEDMLLEMGLIDGCPL